MESVFTRISAFQNYNLNLAAYRMKKNVIKEIKLTQTVVTVQRWKLKAKLTIQSNQFWIEP